MINWYPINESRRVSLTESRRQAINDNMKYKKFNRVNNWYLSFRRCSKTKMQCLECVIMPIEVELFMSHLYIMYSRLSIAATNFKAQPLIYDSNQVEVTIALYKQL